MNKLRFDNTFVRELPGDPEDSLAVRQVHGACWSRVMPTPVAAPRLLAWSPEVAELLDLSAEEVESPEFAEVFGGNALVEGMEPYAACYGGHQFGNWAGQLGDGRAITLGETLNARGERWELQLKGAGPTPYSRMADGRAVLRSSLREFLCSEAMHHLGVPTTRALSLVGTGEQVMRDMFYDGHPRPEPGAVVCRVAPSFIRFGNFELFTSRGELDLLEKLVDFTIARDFPWIEGDVAIRRKAWFKEICERTARMIAHWMRVGFVHGVMNTDNMSVLGLTIDYGPYGWIDNYDLNWTPNTTDAGTRRYRFGAQSQIGQWNLVRFANALHPLLQEVDPLVEGIERYNTLFAEEHSRMWAEKLGLSALNEDDQHRIERLQGVLTRAEMDMTIFFRELARLDPETPSIEVVADAFYTEEGRQRHGEAVTSWLTDYAARLRQDGLPAAERVARMNAANPRYVLRNYLAQEAIDLAEAGDVSRVNELLDVMRKPYEDQPGREHFAAKRPDWARQKAGCSMLSCSS
ncbi:MAG TPA: YdiU family protein [Azoarcus sp.]|nr:YdiU family protein [Azoarcus sp.]